MTSTLVVRLRMFAARTARRMRLVFSRTSTTYVSERVDEYRRYWSDAAKVLGATFAELAPGVWEVQRGRQRTRLANYVTECDNPLILKLAGDKPHGYRVAIAAGAPVPEHTVVTLASISEARRFFARVGPPVVVKPAAGSSSGLGVSTGVRTRRELVAAIALASLFDDRILVERMVFGESYRLLYLAGKLVHAVRRRGDADPASRSRVTRERRTVYDEAVLDLCGPELAAECAKVVRGFGSEFAGVDVITSNPAVSLRDAGGAFIELNTTPGIHHHYIGSPVDGQKPIAVLVLDHLLTRSAS